MNIGAVNDGFALLLQEDSSPLRQPRHWTGSACVECVRLGGALRNQHSEEGSNNSDSHASSLKYSVRCQLTGVMKTTVEEQHRPTEHRQHTRSCTSNYYCENCF